MTKKKLPVRFTGQHFTIDKVLIKDAIRQANISNPQIRNRPHKMTQRSKR